MSLPTRCVLSAILGLLCSGLLLHNAYGLRFEDLVAREGIGIIPEFVGSRLALASLALSLLTLGAIWALRRRRFGSSMKLPPAIVGALPVGLFALALVPGLVMGRLNAAYHPLQWSLFVALPLLLIGLVVATLSRVRPLLVIVALVVIASFGAQLRWGPSGQTRERLIQLESAAARATNDLRTLREQLQTIDAGGLEARSFLPTNWIEPELVRLDDQLSRIVIEEARPPDPQRGILARIPETQELVAWRDLEGGKLEQTRQGIRIDDYSGGGILRTRGHSHATIRNCGTIHL